MKSKHGKAKVLGTLVSVGGALLLTLYKGMPLMNASSSSSIMVEKRKHVTLTEKWAVGSIFLTAGSLMWSSWFLIQARISKSYPCQYSSTAIMSFFSAIQSTILRLIIDRNSSSWIVKGKLEISSIIYSGMVGSGLCYVVMSWCVKQRGPVFTAAFSPFIEISVAVFDVSILHEQIHLGSVLGSVLVIAGMYILLWGKSNEADDCGMKHSQISEESGDCNRPSQIIPVTVNPSSS
ncbi:hypothetical protein F0562_019414 [Nyssa sinensis]|uniref:WAT1-related protein n=1 Tax=Nyssa sinensis TaxID=561372 RepID=A0A5J4ZC84_9ASTE|nr:hypothetical protein F0562_019414 [Nyssa sinensis]